MLRVCVLRAQKLLHFLPTFDSTLDLGHSEHGISILNHVKHHVLILIVRSEDDSKSPAI
jgi:hypothetical protein